MSGGTAQLFDLNIEKILEAWDNAHAVRELIANALDEQALTGTSDVTILRDEAGDWIIRDFGRGLQYRHFTQNENPEKLRATGKVIGKFGVGLKDAMATLDRNHVNVEIESAHGIITLTQRGKHGFGDVVTLHAAVAPARDPGFCGTSIRLRGLADSDMERAKGYFLRFAGDLVLEETRIGKILRREDGPARIYVVGLLVAEEENFAFSYDITSLTEPMRKALNRERTHVGRTAYAERVKAMLLQSRSSEVADTLADQLTKLAEGSGADEIAWKDVAVHACRILNADGKILFVTASQMFENASAIDHAQSDGLRIVTVPETIRAEIMGSHDVNGEPIRDLGVYQSEWNDSFVFSWVKAGDMSAAENAVFVQASSVASLVGGVPAHVAGIRVSSSMRQDFMTGHDALGLWDSETRSIVIRRDQLGSIDQFAAVLLHEIAHARSGYDDVTRDFENELTHMLGQAASAALCSAGHGLPANDAGQTPRIVRRKRFFGLF